MNGISSQSAWPSRAGPREPRVGRNPAAACAREDHGFSAKRPQARPVEQFAQLSGRLSGCRAASRARTIPEGSPPTLPTPSLSSLSQRQSLHARHVAPHLYERRSALVQLPAGGGARMGRCARARRRRPSISTSRSRSKTKRSLSRPCRARGRRPARTRSREWPSHPVEL